MARKFLVPVELPADPVTALQSATKQYADLKGALSGGNAWSGTQIFNSAPQVAQGTLSNHAARLDHYFLRSTRTLTDAATVAVDAATGSTFILTATSSVGNTRALGTPSNPSDGQRLLVLFRQDATGGSTLTLPTGAAGTFEFSVDVPSLTINTAANKWTVFGAVYWTALDRWLVSANTRAV